MLRRMARALVGVVRGRQAMGSAVDAGVLQFLRESQGGARAR